MVELSFRGEKGWRGEVTETLEVEYTGDWETEVSESLQRITSEAISSEHATANEQVFGQFVLGLSETAPVVEIERTNEAITPGPIER